MRNMLRSDLRRLFRMRAFYVSLILLAVVILLTAYGTWVSTQKSISSLVEKAEIETGEDLSDLKGKARVADAVGVNLRSLRRQMTTERLLITPLTGQLPQYLLCILSALLIGRDFQPAYLKNLITVKDFRRKFFWSKLLTLSLACVIVYAAMFPLALIGSWILGNPIVIGEKFLSVILPGNLLTTLADIALMMLLAVLLQNKTAALVSGLILIGGTMQMFCMLIDLAHFLPFTLQDKLLMTQTMRLDQTGLTIKFLLTALGQTAIATAGARLLLDKRDLRV